MTLNDSWGYNAADDNWKTGKQVLKNLLTCVSSGGNLLLNVGPKPDGTIPKESVDVLRSVGRWLRRNGGSVYGTERSPFGGTSTGLTTLKGNTLFMHVLRWPGREIQFCRIANKVRSVHLLATGRELNFQQKGDRLLVRGLSPNAPDRLATVIVAELEGKPQTLDYFSDGWAAEAESLSVEPVAPAPEPIQPEEETPPDLSEYTESED